MGLSIIICTCNPEQTIFLRLLNAILQFNISSTAHEVIIVDNNSWPALAQNEALQFFLSQKKNAKIITEDIPGLTSARIAGIQQAQYDWLIFFDDDNEPAENYLDEIALIAAAYPQVGAWGPGIVNVEYPDAKFEKRFAGVRNIFQERHEITEKVDDKMWWQDCYPPGTGLIIRKDLAIHYADNVLSGNYNLTDRKGKSLSSGGDLQMVLSVIKNGYSAGVHPALKMNHIVAQSRLNRKYLRRLAYGTAISNLPGHVQIWGREKLGILAPPTTLQILRQLYYHLKVKMRKEGILKTEISFCNHLGSWGGLYEINPGVKPLLIWKVLCKALQVK